MLTAQRPGWLSHPIVLVGIGAMPYPLGTGNRDIFTTEFFVSIAKLGGFSLPKLAMAGTLANQGMSNFMQQNLFYGI